MSFRITTLLSGTGRTLENLIARRNATGSPLDFGLVIASKAGVRGLEIATDAGIETRVVARTDHEDVDSFSAAITKEIRQSKPDLVVMAGFMVFYRLPDDLIGRVINIHPSLLPLFGGKGCYGDRVHRAVLDSGVRITGCTVHFVDNEYDTGPIIVQRSCPVAPGDTPESLATRVFEQECEAMPEAVELLRTGAARFQDGRTVFRLDS